MVFGRVGVFGLVVMLWFWRFVAQIGTDFRTLQRLLVETELGNIPVRFPSLDEKSEVAILFQICVIIAHIGITADALFYPKLFQKRLRDFRPPV